jgi:hypothetical protein
MTTIPPAPNQFQVELEPEPPQWPKVIGIISIVWAGLGLTCSGCGLLGIVSQSFTTQMMASQKDQHGNPIPAMPDVMLAGPLEYVQIFFGLLFAGFLMASGIMLLKRRPVARKMHLMYAIVSIVFTLAAIYPGLMKQQRIAEWAAQNSDNFWAASQKQGAPVAMIAIVAGVLIGMAYPVFLAIWFGAVKKNAGEIAQGIQTDPI